ncbi:autotransporter domain-containing protein [Rickettsiales bacterium LUAb2]
MKKTLFYSLTLFFLSAKFLYAANSCTTNGNTSNCIVDTVGSPDSFINFIDGLNKQAGHNNIIEINIPQVGNWGISKHDKIANFGDANTSIVMGNVSNNGLFELYDVDFKFGNGNNNLNIIVNPIGTHSSHSTGFYGNYITFGNGNNTIYIQGFQSSSSGDKYYFENKFAENELIFTSGLGDHQGSSNLTINDVTLTSSTPAFGKKGGISFNLQSGTNTASLNNVIFDDSHTSINMSGDNNSLTLSKVEYTDNSVTGLNLIKLTGANNNLILNDNNRLNGAVIKLNNNATVTFNGMLNNYGYNISLLNASDVTLNFNANGMYFNYGDTNITLSSTSNNTININTDNNTVNLPLTRLINSINDNTLNIRGGGKVTDTSATTTLFEGKHNTINIENTDLTLNGHVLFFSGVSTIDIDSSERAVTIDGGKDINGGVISYATLNINPKFIDDNNLSHDVNINNTLKNFDEINVGNTKVNIDTYLQTTKDLNLTYAVSHHNDQNISGLLNINNADFGNNKVGVLVYGLGEDKIGETFNIDLITSTNKINGLSLDNVNFNDTLFIKKLTANLTDNTLSAEFKVVNNFETIDDDNNKDIKKEDHKNTKTVAEVIDKIIAENSLSESSSLESLINIVSTNSDSAEGRKNVQLFLQSLLPVNNEVLLNITNTNDNTFNNIVLANADNLNKAWFNTSYGNNSIDSIKDVAGANVDTVYLNTGFNKNIDQLNTIGIALGYAQSNIDGKKDFYNGDLQAFKIGVQHTYKFTSDLALTSIASYGYNKFDLTRNIKAQTTMPDLSRSGSAYSKPSLNNLNVNSTINYGTKVESFDTNLYGGLNYSFNKISSYTETGIAPLNVKGSNASLIGGKIGAGISKTLNINQDNDIKPMLNLELGYSYNDMKDTKASFVEDTANNKFINYNPNYNMLTVTPSFSVNYKNKALSLESNLYTNVSIAENTTNVAVGVNFIYRL